MILGSSSGTDRGSLHASRAGERRPAVEMTKTNAKHLNTGEIGIVGVGGAGC